MSRGDDTILIQKMTGATFTKTEQHCQYYQRAKLLPELKNHGSPTLQTKQVTTTKRSDVKMKTLLGWHGAVEETLNKLDHLIFWHDKWEGIKNSKRIDNLWGTWMKPIYQQLMVHLDYMCSMCFDIYFSSYAWQS